MLARLAAAALFSIATCASAAELSGIVTEVQDGDSLTLVNWQHTYRIRLVDIDAPELNQPRGKDSHASLFHLCALKRATAETSGEDRYGRTLARITCAGVDANAEQVRRGWGQCPVAC
jgi:endonuclease YncB( thermonuclease family)